MSQSKRTQKAMTKTHLTKFLLSFLRALAMQWVPLTWYFNSWFNYRFKLREAGSSQSEDRAWEPNAPDFHLELFRTTGFIDSIHFSSMFFEVPTPAVWDQYLNLLAPDHQKVVDAGFTLRPFKHGHERLEDLKLIFEISNQAFKDNPMFEQIPFEIFAAMTLASAQKSNISGSRLCFAPDSSPAGFMFAFFEQSEVICKTVAVLPEYRALGLANAMSYQLSQDSRLAGMNKSVGALIRAGNTSENIGRKHSRIASQMRENRYVLLAKELA
ncbi:hypothetical protein EBU99_07505 [bacterium]|nr:hypothetical protein [bacterium]